LGLRPIRCIPRSG